MADPFSGDLDGLEDALKVVGAIVAATRLRYFIDDQECSEASFDHSQVVQFIMTGNTWETTTRDPAEGIIRRAITPGRVLLGPAT